MRKYLYVFTVLAVLIIFFFLGLAVDRGVTVHSENAIIERENCVIIDAGHGGVDGGATSCTGVLESEINLQIALRLNDLLHLLGVDTVMIRTTDESIYTKGETIAAKKVSDLKERVRIINETENGVLVSIHQNHFADSRYSGAQTFYAQTSGSKELAQLMQSTFRDTINPTNKRQIKKADGIYLMQHINVAGILIECGFLSNTEEERLLRSPEYQNDLCICIATVVRQYLDHRDVH